MIFDQLSKCGKFTMSYKQFCFYVRGAKPKTEAHVQEAIHRPRFGNAGNVRQPPEVVSDTFVHDPSAKGLMNRLVPAGGKKED